MNTTQEPVTPKALGQWATDAQEVRARIGKGRLWLLEAIRAAEGNVDLVATLERANDQFFPAQETTDRLIQGIGAASSAYALPSLEGALTLDQLDTPDTRELLSLLEEAQRVAERIDRARGRHVGDQIPLQPGESAGTDLAESISLLALRMRKEVHGARSPHE